MIWSPENFDMDILMKNCNARDIKCEKKLRGYHSYSMNKTQYFPAENVINKVILIFVYNLIKIRSFDSLPLIAT